MWGQRLTLRAWSAAVAITGGAVGFSHWKQRFHTSAEQQQSREGKSLAEGGPRIKFALNRTGTVEEALQLDATGIAKTQYRLRCNELSDALHSMEAAGLAPVLPDGKVGGNVAFRVSLPHRNPQSSSVEYRDVLIVSPSGKPPGAVLSPAHFLLLHSFDNASWTADFKSSAAAPHTSPTSDSPLLWHALMDAAHKYNWRSVPAAAIHGHALADEAGAALMQAPISARETMFSTKEDVEALSELFAQHPYPENTVFVRKGHGFFVLGESVDAAMQTLQDRVLPHVQQQQQAVGQQPKQK